MGHVDLCPFLMAPMGAGGCGGAGSSPGPQRCGSALGTPQQTPCSLPSLVPNFSQFSTFPAVAPSQGSCKSKPRPTRPGFVQPAGQSSRHLSARGVLPAPCVLRSGGTRLLQGCGRTPQFYPSCFVCPGLRNTCCSWITGACFHLCSPSPGSRSV